MCAILYVANPALQYLSTLSHTRHDFGGGLQNAKCVFWFSVQLRSKTFLFLREIEQDMVQKWELVFM
jgi:hypothetical protein